MKILLKLEGWFKFEDVPDYILKKGTVEIVLPPMSINRVLTQKDTPQKIALQVVLSLNGHQKSPFYN